MRKLLLLDLLLLSALSLAAQSLPAPTELPGDPYFVKTSWVIGGAGDWGTMAVDPTAQRLYITHANQIQVVDLEAGKLLGAVRGFVRAQAIALDDRGQYAYVADGALATVAVIDRQTLSVARRIETGCTARSLVYESRNRLVFAICGAPLASTHHAVSLPPRALPRRSVQPVDAATNGLSQIAMIDADSNRLLAVFELAGDYRSAAAGGDGQVYFSVGAVARSREEAASGLRLFLPPRIVALDAALLLDRAREEADKSKQKNSPAAIDWSQSDDPDEAVRSFAQGLACMNPQGLVADAVHMRLFAACDGSSVAVFNAMTGDRVATVRTGPGNMEIAYDPQNERIFAANANATLSIIRQHGNTDSYAVVQILPTRERALTAAVDPSSGQVYMVTDVMGVDLTGKGGIGTMKIEPVKGSFQVLVIGH